MSDIIPLLERSDWRARLYGLVETTEPNSLTAAIVRSVLNRNLGREHFIQGPILIDEAGIVWAITVKGGEATLEAYDHIAKIRDQWRRLADALKLSDADRIDAFLELGKWVFRDMRAKSTLD